MKGSKGDGGHSKGGSLTAETEPLFPRLHVNQTEKAGPRAPPRNKMALYEQFTIPSHRFVPSNRTASTPYPQQYNQYAYSSYYMPHTAPYPSMGHVVQPHVHPSYGMSSGSTGGKSVVSHDEVPQSVSGRQTVGNPGHPGGIFEIKRAQKQGSGKTSSARLAACPSSGSRNITEDASKDRNDFCVPTLPLHGVHVSGKATQKMQRNHWKKDGQSTCSATNSAVVSQATSFEGRPPDSSTTCDMGLAVVDSRNKPSVAEIPGANVKAQKHGVGKPQQVAKRSGEPCTPRPSGHLFQHSETHGMEHVPELGAECQGLLPNATEAVPLLEDEQESLSSNSHSAQAKNTIVPTIEPKKVCTQSLDGSKRSPYPRDELSYERLESDGEENAGAVNVTPSVCLVRMSENGIRGYVESPQQDTVKASGESPHKALSSVCSVRPKDVIHAVGQQKFWRARKAMLRQQRIFSDQVFELHKLIQVQQLLAKSSSVLINEVKSFEELAGLPSYHATDEEEGHGDEVRELEPSPKEAFKDQPLEMGCHPGLPLNRGSCPTLNTDSIIQGGTHPLSPTFHPGGVSAWGYPSIYPPYNPVPGFCPPVVGQLPQLLSFGFPLDQRQKVSANAHSTHDNAVVSGHQWQTALCQNPTAGLVPPDLLGSWYAMQHAYHQGAFAAGAAAGQSTGSIASINNQPELPMHGMQYLWAGENSLLQSCAEGQKSSADQGQESSPSIHARTNPNVTPSSASSKKSGQGLLQRLDCSGGDEPTTNGEYGGRLGTTKPIDSEVLRWPMKWKEGDDGNFTMEYCDEQMDDERSPDRSLNALNLFPLVPSMSPDLQGGRSRNKPAGGWQGRAIKVTPWPAVATSVSAAEILLSLQQERQ